MSKEKIPAVNDQGYLVSLSNVLVRQDEHIILKDVEFALKPGEFMYLIGRVGSGKPLKNTVW